MRIGLIQTRAAAEPALNLKKTISQIKIAAAKGVQIISTQELFATPYFCQSENTKNFDLAAQQSIRVHMLINGLIRKVKNEK